MNKKKKKGKKSNTWDRRPNSEDSTPNPELIPLVKPCVKRRKKKEEKKNKKKNLFHAAQDGKRSGVVAASLALHLFHGLLQNNHTTQRVVSHKAQREL
jgi:hypothetical protein